MSIFLTVSKGFVAVQPFGLLLLALFSLPSAGVAQERCKLWSARIVSAEGQVEARRKDRNDWRPVRLEEVLCPGDSLRVGERSRANVFLRNARTTLSLDERSAITFTESESEAKTWLEVLKGIIYFISRTPQTLEIKTPYVNAAVEGTEFLVRVDPGQTLVWVFEGRVMTGNRAGRLLLASHEGAVARAGEAPRRYILVKPRDAVQWALYYPPVLDYGAPVYRTGPAAPWIQQALERYRAGDLPGAFAGLEAVPAGSRDSRYFTLEAALLLSVGRVAEARADIEKALAQNARNGQAIALQAMIAVVQNRKEEALGLARRAVELEPASSVPWIALSYTYQATFQVDKALESAQEAIKHNPDDALAWARVAELQLSQGNLKRALKAAREAAARNPGLARTQTVLGFAYLAQINIEQAKAAFEEAIRLDSADPLPRLGLGLAKIRRGDLKKGRREIELAASLDPNNALVRSYLGKAYYEEKRDKLAGTQFDIAEELDPNDPTPWYYSAILKQSENRPVEALYDLQKSIALNDNRAVYRSQLLLDQDQASRYASLGRIYNDLNFEQLALLEGWISVNEDPGNFSGHRLLADSYASLPRHEIARVSELLQSQLLQPLNLTPIQPQLAESRLGILSGAGPSDLAFNEFNSLFVRDGWQLQTNGVAGGNDTIGDDFVVSGLHGKVAYSLGQFHYETEGFRENSDQKIDIYEIFLQASPTYDTSVQLELRANDTEQGDVAQRLNPNDFDSSRREMQRTRLARLGFRYGISTAADFLASLTYESREDNVRLNVFDTPIKFDADVEKDGYGLELQQLFRLERFNIVTGGGYLTQDADENLTTTSPTATGFNDQKDNIRYGNAYTYSQIDLTSELRLTLGASADFLDGFLRDRNQFNPKLGLIWRPWPDTTFRVATFRTLTRAFIASQQTLEPTQVAGFNQFYNDSEATEAWRYGIAADKTFSPSLYTGIEVSRRDLSVPLQVAGPGVSPGISSADWRERVGRAYVYWTPAAWLALNSEFIFERFERDAGFPDRRGRFLDLKTQRLRLGISFFDSAGFSGTLNATYVDQDSKAFGGLSLGDEFWVVDGFIGYRLPKRYGQFSVGFKNLFDENFNYEETDPANPLFYPERLFLAKFTLAF